jgi:adenylate cyclase
MSDIFISYARSTANQAQAVADSLRALGYTIWRDDELPAHRSYADVIAERLAAAKAVVVLWSADAVKSEWVQSEADRARTEHKLVQLALDGAPLPMPFDRIQCADLAGWSGDTDAPGWRKVVASIAALVGDHSKSTHMPSMSRAHSISHAGRLPQSGKPSIAVVPFTDMTVQGDSYFADGMVEEITTALSRFPQLFVNAGGANPAYAGTTHSPAQIAAELGVRYLLEGSIRKSGDRVRIAVKLIEAAAGEQLWAQQFDGTLEDVFALQDTVANAVASQIEPNIEANEIRRAQARPTQDLGAYDLTLRAKALMRAYERGAFLDARAVLDAAIARDPDYAQALSLASICRSMLCVMAWSEAPEIDHPQCLDLAARALLRANDDAYVLAQVAAATAILGSDLAAAAALIARSLHFNPGSSFAWFISGWINVYGGRHLTALQQFDTVLRLDPRSPDGPTVVNGKGYALFALRRFDEALTMLHEVLLLTPGNDGAQIVLAAAFAHFGRLAEARGALAKVSLATITSMLVVFRDPGDRDLLREGLVLAGADV